MSFSEMLFTTVISFSYTFMLMPLFINYFISKKYGQEIREEGPKWHNSKAGTPTMGGFMFVTASFISTLIVGFAFNQITVTNMLILLAMITYGVIGFVDDFLKIFKKQNEGLTSKQKALGQLVVAIIFFVIYIWQGLPMTINLGFMNLHIGYFYGLFILFWLIGFSNAVNLTDGLDGLVTGLSLIAFGTYGIIAYKQQQYDILLVCLSIMGGLLGFLPYNLKPAKIFMGDVGSLALGGMLASISILLHQEWTLLLIGLVFVLETLSVMIQVTYFRKTGKRIFKMSPLHHHFEMSGWSEWKIDIVFWTVGLLMSVITLLILY